MQLEISGEDYCGTAGNSLWRPDERPAVSWSAFTFYYQTAENDILIGFSIMLTLPYLNVALLRFQKMEGKNRRWWLYCHLQANLARMYDRREFLEIQIKF